MKKIIITLSLVLLCTIAYTQTKDCGITFEFENGEVIIENSQKYYAFDVVAYASEDATYFGSSMVYINYDTISFGENITSEGNVVVEKGTLLQGELSQGVPLFNIVNVTDNTSSRVAITTEYNFPMLPANSNILPTSAIQYLHITMKIVNESGCAGLSFQEPLMQGQQYQSDETTIYDPVTATDIDNTDLPVFQPGQETTIHGILKSVPNPFGSTSGQTTLAIVAPQRGKITLNVFNIKGQHIAKVYENEHKKNDEFSIVWNGEDEQQIKLPSGIYLFQMLVNEQPYQIEKIMIIR